MKISFEELDYNVSKLYEMPIDEGNEEAIYIHCDMITSYIESVGWTEEEYNNKLYSNLIDKSIN